MLIEVAQHRGASLMQPSFAVGRDPGLAHVGDQPAMCVGCDSVAGGGLNNRQVIGADDPQGPSHCQMLNHRTVLVQLALEISDREPRAPRP